MKNVFNIETYDIKPYTPPKKVPEYCCEGCLNCHNDYCIKHKRPINTKLNKCFYHSFYKGIKNVIN